MPFCLIINLETSIDIYKRINEDFLFAPGQPGTFGAFGGVVAVPYENIGSISNKGVEMSFVWKDILPKDWKYDVGTEFDIQQKQN